MENSTQHLIECPPSGKQDTLVDFTEKTEVEISGIIL